MSERKPKRSRRKRRAALASSILTLLLAIPAAYMAAALVGSFVPVNKGWTEPKEGITVYLAGNAIHTDLILPVDAEGLDWAPLFPARDFAWVDPNAGFIAFGSGEKHVYLDTPTWWDLTPRAAASALIGGERVVHVEYVPSPSYAIRQIRLRPVEYRRLWAAIRAGLRPDSHGRPIRIDHPGYGRSDAFYQGTGKANAIRTCNWVVADWLRLAGVESSVWPPFADGLIWRYRRNNGPAPPEPAQST